jgi:transcriptional regulator with GAF, ATPase, and Fis domain
MPPLRERGRDAALLAEHFAERFVRKYGGAAQAIDAPLLDWVVAQAWPGNIRELENWVHREVLVGEHAPHIEARTQACAHAAPAQASAALPNYREAKAAALANFEREYLRRALRLAQGNVSRAAALAGKERRAFGKLLKKHAIERGAG